MCLFELFLACGIELVSCVEIIFYDSLQVYSIQNALVVASEAGNDSIVTILLERGPVLNSNHEVCKTLAAALWACGYYHSTSYPRFWTWSDVHVARQQIWRRAFLGACSNGHGNVVDLLLTRANSNIFESEVSRTTVHVCARVV